VIASLGTQEFCESEVGINPGHEIAKGRNILLSPIKRSQQKRRKS